MTACLHPITFDTSTRPEPSSDEHAGADYPCPDVYRACALCGAFYNRTARILDPLRLICESAWRVDFGRVARAIRDEGEWRGEDFAP